MNDDTERPATVADGDTDACAASPEPSLAVRLDKSATGAPPTNLGRPAGSPRTEPIPDDQETGLTERMREGAETAPRSGRVDAPGATYGPDPDRRRIERAPEGGLPGSRGAQMDTPGDPRRDAEASDSD